MRVVTYNLRMGGARRIHWRTLLDEHDADLLLLQESYPPSIHLAGSPHARRNDRWVWRRASTNTWGSAIFSRWGKLEPISIRGYNGWAVGALLTGLPRAAGIRGPLAVFSVHVPYGPGGYHGQAHTIMKRLSPALQRYRALVGGDFNVRVNDPHRPERVRASARFQWDIEDQWQLTNCWRHCHPQVPAPHTLRWTRNPETLYSCDGLYISNRLAVRVANCEVKSGPLWNGLSDHNPMFVELRSAAPKT